jgi:hypothetical protein
MQDGKRIAVQIPEGATVLAVHAIPGHQSGGDHQQVDVQWQGKSYTMFLVDLRERGEPIRSAEEK